MQLEPTIVSEKELRLTTENGLKGLLNGAMEFIQGDTSGISQLVAKQIGLAVLGVLILVVVYFVAKLASRYCSVPIRKRVDETLGKFVGQLVFYTIMVATMIGVIGLVGIKVTSFAAVLTAAGFAVGLAFQGTLSNFAAGILLLVFRPFKVGDSVVVAGTKGKVYEIDLFSTAIDTSDNRRIILPNSSIAGNTIENMTYHVHRRIDVTVGIAYDCDLMASRVALTEAAESLGDLIIRGDDRGYKIALENLGPHSVDWVVQAWVKTSDLGMAKEILTVSIKENLDAAGLRIPYPQLDIHWQGNQADQVYPEHLSSLNNSTNTVNTFTPRRRAA